MEKFAGWWRSIKRRIFWKYAHFVQFLADTRIVLIQRKRMMTILLITYYALINGINPTLATKMAKVESNMNPLAKSNTGDGGLFQLNKRSFKFHNESWRFDVAINTALALKYLADLKSTCKHKIDNTYVICYNLGINGGSKIKNPKKQTYYRKINSI